MVRRLSWSDLSRAPGAISPLRVSGRTADLLVAESGDVEIRARGSVEALIDSTTTEVLHLATEPRRASVEDLTGLSVMRGFRAALAQADPVGRERRDGIGRLLDDLPVVSLISGHALVAAGLVTSGSDVRYTPRPGQCAGFAEGGPFMVSIQAGRVPIPLGPAAPDLDADLPEELRPDRLGVHGMRRRRRTDLRWAGEGEGVRVDATFRDSHMDADGIERIVHEYTLDAVVDLSDGVVREARATPRVLPWQACPLAATSATRIEGVQLSRLDDRVRREVSGVGSCTHLNDLLRTLADVPRLAALLPR